VTEAAAALAGRLPAVAAYLPRVAFAVNQAYAAPDTPLRGGDELALIPPVSGGADSSRMTDCTVLTRQPLAIDDSIRFLYDGAAGGVSLFLGTTRAEQNGDGAELLALEYEAYESMAREQLQALAGRARERWPILKLVLLHRLGRVALGEPSVFIGVSTPHRAEAFEACRWLIDTLKAEAAIWKKEIWSDGEGSWVHPVKESG
jgi:molybdopterin synthase catalytic subunit